MQKKLTMSKHADVDEWSTVVDRRREKRQHRKDAQTQTLHDAEKQHKCHFYDTCGNDQGKAPGKQGVVRFWPYCDACFQTKTSTEACTFVDPVTLQRCDVHPLLQNKQVGVFHERCETHRASPHAP